MDKGCDAAFGYVGVDARPTFEAVNAEVEQGHCGLCCNEESCIVGIPYAGNRVDGCDGVADLVMFDPFDDMFCAEVKEERG